MAPHSAPLHAGRRFTRHRPPHGSSVLRIADARSHFYHAVLRAPDSRLAARNANSSSRMTPASIAALICAMSTSGDRSEAPSRSRTLRRRSGCQEHCLNFRLVIANDRASPAIAFCTNASRPRTIEKHPGGSLLQNAVTLGSARLARARSCEQKVRRGSSVPRPGSRPSVVFSRSGRRWAGAAWRAHATRTLRFGTHGAGRRGMRARDAALGICSRSGFTSGSRSGAFGSTPQTDQYVRAQRGRLGR